MEKIGFERQVMMVAELTSSAHFSRDVFPRSNSRLNHGRPQWAVPIGRSPGDPTKAPRQIKVASARDLWSAAVRPNYLKTNSAARSGVAGILRPHNCHFANFLCTAEAISHDPF